MGMSLSRNILYSATNCRPITIYTKCAVSCLSVCLSGLNAFIQFSSDHHGISHGCSQVHNGRVYITIAAGFFIRAGGGGGGGVFNF
jgi:hypothetical protein